MKRARLAAGLAVAASLYGLSAPAQATLPPGPAATTPPGFLWGVATAGNQYEGGDATSNWARWIAAGRTPDRHNDGARGYDMYAQDLDLARGMGLNTWRMSLEWSRIEPKEGQIDRREVAHYHQELAAVRARGMTPVVTLMHFAYPAWVDAKGGWESPAAVEAYERYVRFVAKEFGSQIDWYLTFNEPNMFLQGGYEFGFFPPGKKLAIFSAMRVARNLITAHRAAYDILHAARPDAHVSFNLYATRLRLFGIGPEPEFSSPTEGWFLREALAGKRTLDFACLDYYCRTTLSQPSAHEGWEVYPRGFYDTLEQYYHWTGLPVLVAENGLATRNGDERKDGWTRGAYLVAHVRAMQQAMADGVPVLGYIHWSITDNYEWGSYGPRFGLYRVEARRGDFRRIPTDGVAAFAAVARASGVTPAIAAAFPAPGTRPAIPLAMASDAQQVNEAKR